MSVLKNSIVWVGKSIALRLHGKFFKCTKELARKKIKDAKIPARIKNEMLAVINS